MRRLGDVMLAAAILFLLGLAVARLDQLATREIAGDVRINDGDSLTLGGERIRLRGIDAPELDQHCTLGGRSYACGERARRALLELANSAGVTCQAWERDRYDRLLAHCEAGGRNLGQAMVEEGWAVSYGDYLIEELAARQARRGIWAGSFDKPRDWRSGRRGPYEPMHDWPTRLINVLRQLFLRST